ncbi:MAG: putative NOL1/NOP2/Sun domain family, member 2 [Streblomastix strix]|uniref:Putative NOL1/NOP2/Sun domain family, member 2 n=1 Tax=Streblomastix strix TaxID=222440 RepID=A0A5J4V8C3_9EUKA|nr:MAG: putative NOL1/NOP2/Sun domain family, member 2 [Streblomastix strix]
MIRIKKDVILKSPNLVVVNHDASCFPFIRLKNHQSSSQQQNTKQHFLFDRVLCDVPCSGDGTMRKAPDIWMGWTTSNGMQLHGLQLRIAQRGALLLKEIDNLKEDMKVEQNLASSSSSSQSQYISDIPRMVYSTCTLNPIEDEAVVTQLLLSQPQLELLDVSQEIPLLKRRQGVSNWQVQDMGEQVKSFDLLKNSRKKKLKHTLWPPRFEYIEEYQIIDKDNLSPLHLERCLRIYPHLQDTGGFFIAVLTKVKQSQVRKERIQLHKCWMKEELRREEEEKQRKKRIEEDNIIIAERKKQKELKKEQEKEKEQEQEKEQEKEQENEQEKDKEQVIENQRGNIMDIDYDEEQDLQEKDQLVLNIGDENVLEEDQNQKVDEDNIDNEQDIKIQQEFEINTNEQQDIISKQDDIITNIKTKRTRNFKDGQEIKGNTKRNSEQNEQNKEIIDEQQGKRKRRKYSDEQNEQKQDTKQEIKGGLIDNWKRDELNKIERGKQLKQKNRKSKGNKNKMLKDANNKEETNKNEQQQSSEASQIKQNKPFKKKQQILTNDPFVSIDDQMEGLTQIRKFYGINEDDLPTKWIMARNIDTANVLYLVSPTVRQILIGEEDDEQNEDQSKILTEVNSKKTSRFNVINAGVRIFEKDRLLHGVEQTCSYRISQDGVSFIARIMKERKVLIPRNIFVELLQKNNLPISEVPQAVTISIGTFVIELDQKTALPGDPPVDLCALRGRANISLMVKKTEIALLQALFSSRETIDKQK